MEKKLYETYRRIEHNHWWFVGRRKIVQNLLARFFVNKNSSILDIGSNTGFFVGLLQMQGFNVSGCDISAEAIEFGKQSGVRNLSVISSTSLPYKDSSFDVVLCLDVLEHIDDDQLMLKEIHRLLKPNGLLVLMVPAFGFLWGVQDVAAHHFRRYDRKKLKKIISLQSWDIILESYFNFFLFVPIACVRLIQKIWKPKRVSDFDLNNVFFNTLFKIVFLFEVWCLKYISYPWGISLLTILKKKV